MRFRFENGALKLGDGNMGGKARGLAFVHNLLTEEERLRDQFYPHTIHKPQFAVITADWFEQFLNENKLWFAVEEEDNDKIIRAFLNARLPEKLVDALREFLSQNQEPLAVRSSTLHDDTFYHPLAGTYKTLLIPNCHPDINVRLRQLCQAIKHVYASLFYVSAKRFLEARGLAVEDERMAIILQKLVGNRYGSHFYPHITGVAQSLNFFPIGSQRAEDGVVMVVFGLGRRAFRGGEAVRFCPKSPFLRPELTVPEQLLATSQKKVIALNLERNLQELTGSEFDFLDRIRLDELTPDLAYEMLVSTFSPQEEMLYDDPYKPGIKIVTFNRLLRDPRIPLSEIICALLELFEEGLDAHVVMKFTALIKQKPKLSLDFHVLQVHPLVTEEAIDIEIEKVIEGMDVVLETNQVLGHGVKEGIRDIVYVPPRRYDYSKGHEIAKKIGELNSKLQREGKPYLLIGPGRWGSISPRLGVPVRFLQVSGASAIVELNFSKIAREPSQGTHFFRNLVTQNTIYMAYALDEREKNQLAWLDRLVKSNKPVVHIELDNELVVVSDVRKRRGVIAFRQRVSDKGEKFELPASHYPKLIKMSGGEIGGKGRGLKQVQELLSRGELDLEKELLKYVYIPQTVVIGTAVFDEFGQKSGLFRMLGKAEPEELQAKVLSAPLPAAAQAIVYKVCEFYKGPLAVRSSSLMEDSYSLSFAGIYETVFVSGYGSAEQRRRELAEAIRRVWASTYSRSAMAFRQKHQKPDEEERMAVLIQPVVGRKVSNYVYPLISGVAYSRNYYPWSARLNMSDGVCRIVAGLGTKAVGRNPARLFAPGQPAIRPEGQVVQLVLRYSPTRADVIDIERRGLVEVSVAELARLDPRIWLLASVLKEGYLAQPVGIPSDNARPVLTFERLLRDELFPFTKLLWNLLIALERSLGFPVDIEFAVEKEKKEWRFYVLQCRPQMVLPDAIAISVPEVPEQELVIKSGNCIGYGKKEGLEYLVYVDPDLYLAAEPAQQTAINVGRANRELEGKPYILVGPGRWGSVNQYLGVPVVYDQICNAAVIAELSTPRFTPEFSFGTHFFGDLAADNTFYIAIFPEQGDRFKLDESLVELYKEFGNVVKVYKLKRPAVAVVDGSSRQGVVYCQNPDEGK